MQWAICSERSDRRHSSCIPEQANRTDDLYWATVHRGNASSKKTTPDVSLKEHITNHWNSLKILDETELETKTRLWKLLIHQLKHLNKHVIRDNTLQVCGPWKKKGIFKSWYHQHCGGQVSGSTKTRCKFQCWSDPSSVKTARAFLHAQEAPQWECHQRLPGQPPSSSASRYNLCSRCQTTTAPSQVARTLLLCSQEILFLPHNIP